MLDALRIVLVAKPADYQMQVKSRLSKVGAELIQQVSPHSAHYSCMNLMIFSAGHIEPQQHPDVVTGASKFYMPINAFLLIAKFPHNSAEMPKHTSLHSLAFLGVQDVVDAARLLDKVTGLNVAVCEPFYLGIIRQLWAEK